MSISTYRETHSSRLVMDPVLIVEDTLTVKQLEALRSECNYLRVQQPAADPTERGSSLDFFEDQCVPENSSARVNMEEYFTLRMCKYMSKGSSDLDSACIKNLLHSHLPSLLNDSLSTLVDDDIFEIIHANKRSRYNKRDWFLFNEHYVVKEASSMVEFRWHRDEDEQLAALVGDKKPLYWSVWIPLDDVNAHNGTIYFPDNTQIIKASQNGKMPLERVVATEALVSTEGEPVIVKAGSIVIFSSQVWHRSSINQSSEPRRVYYAQYSSEIILSGGLPLNLALKCSIED